MALAPTTPSNQQTWLHGTSVNFTSWKLPLPKKLKHKNGMAPHSALFFTLSRKYAIGSSEGTGGLVTSTLIPSANVIDLNTCTDSESDAFRRQVLTKETAGDNQQYLTLENWREACKTGSVMKYAPPPSRRHLYEHSIIRVKMSFIQMQGVLRGINYNYLLEITSKTLC